VQGSVTGPIDLIHSHSLIHYDSSPELHAPQDSRAKHARLAGKAKRVRVDLVDLVCFVHLVSLV